jgi:hypothetical protein
MDIESGLIGLATVCLVALVIGGVLAVRKKNIAVGVGIFLIAVFASVLMLGLIGPLYLYAQYVPERIHIKVGFIVSIIAQLSMSVVYFLQFRRIKIAGNIILTGQAKYAQMSQAVAMLIFMYCLLSLITDVNEGEAVKRNVFWWIVMVFLLLIFYYSTEWRQKGFVYRGRSIPFTDVVQARWVGHWTNTTLKVKLANGEELAFTVPAELAPVIESYLRNNFPTP